MAVSPLVSPIGADFIAGAAVPIDRWRLAGHLALFLGVAGLVGIVARFFVGGEAIARRRSELDGLGVVLFFIFAIALTDGIIDAAIERPLFVLAILALSFGLAGASFLAAFLVWRGVEKAEAMTLALATGLRNMGLLVAVIGASSVPATTFIFFALSQFPIYFAPQLLKPLARRLQRGAEASGLPAPPGGDRRGARL
jgi:BASS family bile acid:Na+ symporter